MKHTILIALLVHIVGFVAAQPDSTQYYLLTAKAVSYGVSTPQILDPYLSPMTYGGTGISYEILSSKYLSCKNRDYSTQSKLNLSLNLLQNPARTSEMQQLGVNYAWGINYHIPTNAKLRILVGGLWDVNFGFKNLARNINNPINLDLATNLNITGSLIYDLPFFHRNSRLRMVVSSPVLGYMFVPEGGASYYNMFTIGNMTNTFHWSSLNNKNGLNHTYSVEIPLKKITWQLGVNVQQLKYKANNLVFIHNDLSLMIGTRFDIISFSGTKMKAPRNFMSPND